MARQIKDPLGCVTNVARALQNKLAKLCNATNDINGENFKLKFVRVSALGTADETLVKHPQALADMVLTWSISVRY